MGTAHSAHAPIDQISLPLPLVRGPRSISPEQSKLSTKPHKYNLNQTSNRSEYITLQYLYINPAPPRLTSRSFYFYFHS